MKYDRAAIMRESWRLRRKGLDASTALRWAWATAKRDALERVSVELTPFAPQNRGAEPSAA